jgi:hypothetical protein
VLRATVLRATVVVPELCSLRLALCSLLSLNSHQQLFNLLLL